MGGNDVLDGRLGSDDLTGGKGKDTFVFSSEIAKDVVNVDTLRDFTTFVDKIQLNKVVFANAKAGAAHRLLASDFSDNAANPGNAHIIYNKANGHLSYDSDGSGRAAAIQFAKVLSGSSPSDLTYFDILVV